MKFTVLLVASGAVHADSKYIDLDCTPADLWFLEWTFTDNYKNELQAWKNQGKDSKVFEEVQETVYKFTLGITLKGVEVDKDVSNIITGEGFENRPVLLGESIRWNASELKIHTYMPDYRVVFTVSRSTGKYTATKSPLFERSIRNWVSASGECDVNVFGKAENAF